MNPGAVPLQRSFHSPGQGCQRELAFSYVGRNHLDLNRGKPHFAYRNTKTVNEGESCSFHAVSYHFRVLNRSSTRSTRRSRATLNEMKRAPPLKALSKCVWADFKTDKSRTLHSLKCNYWIHSRKLGNFGYLDGHYQHWVCRGSIKTCADVKSEPYDITDLKPGTVKFPEVLSEVVLPEDELQHIAPWQKQFPKRWMIVSLCSSAFLLCNMDRVCYSPRPEFY